MGLAEIHDCGRIETTATVSGVKFGDMQKRQQVGQMAGVAGIIQGHQGVHGLISHCPGLPVHRGAAAFTGRQRVDLPAAERADRKYVQAGRSFPGGTYRTPVGRLGFECSKHQPITAVRNPDPVAT